MSSTTNTKTLYTPVFFSSSEPPRGSRSATSANLKVPSSYLNTLSRNHIALAQIVQEEPSSRPGSPTEDADGSYPDSSTHERISALRARVQEAWAMADGNPADGKWTLLTHLLRMGVTSGKAGRWAGTRADLKPPEAPDGDWINAATESEWAEWEKRIGLKDKVENWKMRLETHEKLDSPSIKDTQNTPNIEPSSNSERQKDAKTADGKTDHQVINTVDQVASIPTSSIAKTVDSTPIQPVESNPKLKAASRPTNSNPLKDNSLFGFSVVKRSNAPAAAVGKKPHVDPKPDNRLPNDAAAAPPADDAQATRKIVDIPETSFLPPSFPSSQIMTSTPNAKPVSSDKHKPEPIPFTASPSLLHIDGPVGPVSSPSSSQRVTKVYGRSSQNQLPDKPTSLPAIPSATTLLPLPPVPTTPTRNRHDSINDNNKRLLHSANEEVEYDRAVKKARTMPSLDPSPIAAGSPPPENGTNSPFPTTPKRQNLPTLTELLASTKKGKKKLHSPKSLKSKSAVGAGVEASTSKLRFPSPPAALEDNPYMLDPYAISVNHELDVSPTKSLSSLAGSDSEDEHEDEDDDELKHQFDFSPSSFNPYATSTQHQNYLHEGRKGQFTTSPHSNSSFPGENGRAGAGLSLGFGGYNSQFDVAGQVDKVDKLLEKDVDYEGWLRDPSLEKEGVRVEESP